MTSESEDVSNWLAEASYYAQQDRKPNYCTSEAEDESDWNALERIGVRPTPRSTNTNTVKQREHGVTMGPKREITHYMYVPK